MTILDELQRDPRRVFDRLVDGELGPQQRREVLAALDEQPGAWRQCALAFLEAQAWRLQMSRTAAEPILAQLTATDKPGRSRRLWGAWLATAASVLTAFVVGTRFPTITTPTPEPVAVENDAQSTVATTAAPTITVNPTEDGDATGNEMLAQLPTDGDAMQVQVLPLDAEDPVASAGTSWAISNALVRQFEKDGFTVSRQERFVPLSLSDGRQVLVPIEDVEIRTPQVERL